MTTVKTAFSIILLGLFCVVKVSAQKPMSKDILISFVDTMTDEYGYKNLNGDTIIPLGKYSFCFTDTLKTYAIVGIPQYGFVAIDKQEKILYTVFPFDNGPDYVSNGLFRILQNGKIGYAEASTGNIIISPQYDCAWPFENGVAKVSTNCKTIAKGEHSTWQSDHWFYINKSGKKINPQKTKLKNHRK